MENDPKCNCPSCAPRILSRSLGRKLPWLGLLICFALPARLFGAFGVTDNGTEFVVNTGAGLVFKVVKSNGTVDSWVYNGVEYNGPSGKGSQIASGLGSATVTATTVGNVVQITIQTDNSNTVATNLTHYIIVTNGLNNVYMASYPTHEPGVGEFRWITRLSYNLLPNSPAPSNNNGNTNAIESSDVFGHANGTTTSKYYGDSVTHSKDRAMDLTWCGATGSGVGVWMIFGNRESSSGGPFFRDIENQGDGTGSDQEVYNYMNSGHAPTEANRLNVLHGPYVLVWNNGSTPVAPDTSWLGSLGLTGWVGPSGRGTVSGSVSGLQPGIQGVVGLANASAQYWATVDGSSNYTIGGVKAGTYTAILYQGELGVATNSSVTVNASATTTLNLTSGWPNPTKVFQIGDWDSTPQGFLNATNILGLSEPNFITMHPQDVRMNSWGASNVFNLNTDPVSVFPSIIMRGVNPHTYINFILTNSQITTLTFKIGASTTYNGARPDVKINGHDLGFPSASTWVNSRTWTVGTYRGFNQFWKWTVPSADLMVGQNTLDISPVSGSGDLSPWLSAGWVYDSVELDGPSFSVNTSPPLMQATFAGGVLTLSWPANFGWTLQAQTNGLSSGLGTNWADVPGSTGMTSTNIPVDTTEPTVFYRLRL